ENMIRRGIQHRASLGVTGNAIGSLPQVVVYQMLLLIAFLCAIPDINSGTMINEHLNHRKLLGCGTTLGEKDGIWW
ncbi:hypothetical protein BDN67DRAFT_967683, partial [Paxillus ammoniavirescens]